MKKIDGEKSPKLTIREQSLCCLVNIKYKCTRCQAAICYECNEKDAETESVLGIDISLIGHTKEECLLQTENEANNNWCVVDQCDGTHTHHYYEKQIDQATIGKDSREAPSSGTV